MEVNMQISAQLKEKGRIAKVLFAMRHLDKVIKNGNGSEVRIPQAKTQSDIANKMNLTFQQIQKYENAKNGIQADKLFKLCKTCNYDILKFFEGNPEEILKEIDQKKHPMIYKKFHAIDLNIIDEQKLNNRYLSEMPKLEKEMAYQNTFKDYLG